MIPLQLPAIMTVAGLFLGYFQSGYLFGDRLIGMAAGLTFFSVFLLTSTWILRALKRLKADEYAMGWGDPILIGAIGAGLGWRPLPIMILLASLQGILMYSLFTWTRKPLPEDDWVPPQKSMPFGPFLALSAIEISMWNLIYY